MLFGLQMAVRLGGTMNKVGRIILVCKPLHVHGSTYTHLELMSTGGMVSKCARELVRVIREDKVGVWCADKG